MKPKKIISTLIISTIYVFLEFMNVCYADNLPVMQPYWVWADSQGGMRGFDVNNIFMPHCTKQEGYCDVWIINKVGKLSSDDMISEQDREKYNFSTIYTHMIVHWNKDIFMTRTLETYTYSLKDELLEHHKYNNSKYRPVNKLNIDRYLYTTMRDWLFEDADS